MDKHLKVRHPKHKRKAKIGVAKGKIKNTVASNRLMSDPEKVLMPKQVKQEIHDKMSKAFANKITLLKQAYKMYSEDYMKVNKTAKPPVLRSNDQVVSAVSPYLQAAAEKLPPEIYEVVPALTDLSTDGLKEAAYGLGGTVGGMVGSMFGPEGKIIGQIGGEVISAFIKWGIEEDGFEKIGDFIADAVSEIGDFIDDAVSEVGSFVSDVGSFLDLW